jgi:hypothetical protein
MLSFDEKFAYYLFHANIPKLVNNLSWGPHFI